MSKTICKYKQKENQNTGTNFIKCNFRLGVMYLWRGKEKCSFIGSDKTIEYFTQALLHFIKLPKSILNYNPCLQKEIFTFEQFLQAPITLRSHIERLNKNMYMLLKTTNKQYICVRSLHTTHTYNCNTYTVSLHNLNEKSI